jgi:hypothetical protein
MMHRKQLEVSTHPSSGGGRRTLLLSRSKWRIVLAPLIFSRHVFLADWVLHVSPEDVSGNGLRCTECVRPRIGTSRRGYCEWVH